MSNINLRDLLHPGQVFHGITAVQTDYHVWQNLQADWVVTDVYPNWLKAKNTKNRTFGRTGTEKSYLLKAGKEATFTIGDLVMSGVIRQ